MIVLKLISIIYLISIFIMVIWRFTVRVMEGSEYKFQSESGWKITTFIPFINTLASCIILYNIIKMYIKIKLIK